MGLYFRFIQSLTKIICISATVSLVGMWIFIYNLDNDSSVIESKVYFKSEDDKFPVMSLCFKQFLDDNSFRKYGANITANAYKEFNFGQHFENAFMKIDFNEVTSNISDFILHYEVEYRNGTELNTTENIAWKPLYYTFSWNSWGHFLKCFGFEIIDRNVYHVRIFISRKIFRNSINDIGGTFATLFHYPNQVLSSLQTVKRQWLVWPDNKTNHYISFNIKNVDVTTLRFKDDRENCVPDWKRYDNITLENHLKSCECRTPDQTTASHWPICSTKEKMKQARIHLNNNERRPCRKVNSVDFDLGESKSFEESNRTSSDHWFCITIRILNHRFKDTIQQKEVDIQTLIGYIGGYIGILTGFSLIQIPEIMMTISKHIRKYINEFR